MKFGVVDNPEEIDFSLPDDHHDTEQILNGDGSLCDIYVGCAKWNRQDLKGFYPRGTKDELAYYAQQFNSIEMNATFYNDFSANQIEKWVERTPDEFMFFPKVHRIISHIKRLKDVESSIIRYTENIRSFGRKLGMCFLQLHDNFSPENYDRLETAVSVWPRDLPLAVELRNAGWFSSADISNRVYSLFEKYKVSNIITDTAGRRDLLHMRLTRPDAFIRYVGSNHQSDYSRLREWAEKIQKWKAMGLRSLYFFVHQNTEVASPLLSIYFIKQLNEVLGTDLKVPIEFRTDTLF
ncbi:MAG: DUF72 domain-containing protein [Bacteroidota bacterium]